jgi:hydrogenase/urease accessory protein HupE
MNGGRALATALILFAGVARAHEVRPAYLELQEVAPDRYALLWKVPARGEDQRLGLHLRLPGRCQHAAPPSVTIGGGACIERSRLHCAGGLAGAQIHIDGLATTLTDVLVRVARRDGSTQVTRVTPDRPRFVVEAAPHRTEVVRTYLRLGIEHILSGVDHLLFILALLLLVRDRRRLVGTVTAFTAAHSLTLTAATLGFVRVPQQPVEAVIALSIVFVAAEVARPTGHSPLAACHSPLTARYSPLAARRPWLVSFTFGLLHGFGFAGALHEVGLPQTAIPLALAFFNVGVEIGQLLFIAAARLVLVPAARGLERLRVHGAAVAPLPAWERAAAYAIGSVAAFWAIQRTAAFLA